MGVPRLVLVEGMIGAGKTTTAGRIAQWLVGRGEDARAFTEFDLDHPVRTAAVEELRASYPSTVAAGWSAARPGADHALEQWARLAR